MSLPAFVGPAVAVLLTFAATPAVVRAQSPLSPVPAAPSQPPVRLEWERFMSGIRSGGAALPPGVTVVDSASDPRVRAMANMLQQRVAAMNRANGAGSGVTVECPMRVSRMDSSRVPEMRVGRGDSAAIGSGRSTVPPCVNPLDR